MMVSPFFFRGGALKEKRRKHMKRVLMKTLTNEKGFSLIELILVVALLAILAVSIAPQAQNILSTSQTRAAEGVAGQVRSGITTFFADQMATNGVGAYPVSGGLDGAAVGACAAANTCFSNVVSPAITADWSKTANDAYTHTPSGTAYTYFPATGEFRQ